MADAGGREPVHPRFAYCRRISAGGARGARAELGLLDNVPKEQAADAERADWLALLRSEGLLPETEPDEATIILAMHRFLAQIPSRLTSISPYDVITGPRQPNLPGTVDENWRLPRSETLEELRADPRVAEIGYALTSAAEQCGASPSLSTATGALGG